ncbi:Fmu (Sun) domain-containing protein [Ferruginibacter sp. HRS2-29]|uniref:Fmu (Sun) domain-containing protein n=1 Tax=Ferruginibacter sp. HRS2-29 TaxID=2487334 RepID=UPI0020CFB10F|nr:Fmu (Sun) domain-containing protein [Ferruginibacter sp. HRS2-29]MCP9750661.1 Fmu (Sun) domain-containing protein [Ferruginibacter sp. HRS2-29]
MSKYHSHISSAQKITDAYKGEEPFVHFIRKYFAANKKYGSKDRKAVAAICYDHFRTATALKERSRDDQFILAVFLCEQQHSELLAFFYPELNEKIGLPVEEKIGLLNIDAQQLFPFHEQLSPELDEPLFSRSFLQQPKLFIRLRPGREQVVKDKFKEAGIIFEEINTNSLALKNATSLEEIISINRDAVIQDLNSQHVLDYLDEHTADLPAGKKTPAWDCCAASGGKAILLHDKLKGKVQLTVSDIRKSILHNCEKRLQQARVDIYRSFVADLTQKNDGQLPEDFPIIVCDAPCTGSGTWGRTPEQLFFFHEKTIGEYAQKQQTIAAAALQHLQPGGLFFYITCSVFEKENEGVVKFLQEKKGVKLLQAKYYKGYEKQADTMFAAVFTR